MVVVLVELTCLVSRQTDHLRNLREIDIIIFLDDIFKKIRMNEFTLEIGFAKETSG